MSNFKSIMNEQFQKNKLVFPKVDFYENRLKIPRVDFFEQTTWTGILTY